MSLSSHDQRLPARVLITGGAGFIGSHLADRLIEDNSAVTVIDSFDDYYDQSIKRSNISRQVGRKNYKLVVGDIRDEAVLGAAFAEGPFDVVMHLAALAGVRPSLERPVEYLDVNVRGTQKLLDKLKDSPTTRLLFASSSSVYGNREALNPFSEEDRIDKPYSPYAASKAAGELACHVAHACFGLNVVCLRFFTVYGPRQRPDLAINKFCRLIDDGQPIEVYGDGSTQRDYTFVHDTVSGIVAAMTYAAPGFDIINLGRGEPVQLSEMIDCLERSLGKKTVRIHKSEQTGDVSFTHANIEKARRVLNYEPRVSIADGIDSFVRWYKEQKTTTNASAIF
jgi:UDP-glucuronate 4-epimerase